MQRFVAVLLLCCCILIIPAHAVGEGYSGMDRVYTLSGVDKDVNVSALALLYGSGQNDSANDYVYLIKVNEKRGGMLIDVSSGTQFNKMIQDCFASSQMDVSAYNQIMLENGAPDEWLL